MNNLSVQTLSPVISNDAVMLGVQLIWLEAPEIAEISQPGQFVMISCAGGAFLRRPLSIHRISADKTRLAFLFAIVGQGTTWLGKVRPGDYLDLRGPLGNSFSITPKIKNAVLVAGGLGLAPLVFLADELRNHGIQVSLLYGATTAEFLCPDRLLPEGVEIAIATEDGSRGHRGFVTNYLSNYTTENKALFVCGPLPMYRTITQLDTLKNQSIQVSLEVRMACGLGVCYGCTINTRQGPRQVCRQGPIFDLHQILWDELADI